MILLADIIIELIKRNWMIDRPVDRVTMLDQAFQTGFSSHQWRSMTYDAAKELADTLACSEKGIPESEIDAVVEAVISSIKSASLTEQTLFEVDMDPQALAHRIKDTNPKKKFWLCDKSIWFYEEIIDEFCKFIVEIAPKLPNFKSLSAREELRRQRHAIEMFNVALSKSPETLQKTESMGRTFNGSSALGGYVQMGGTTRTRIFLAHAMEDKPQVRNLYNQLKKDGFDPWLDEIDILPGQIWKDEIPRAIREAGVFLACLSRHSVSKVGYVQSEFRRALSAFGERPAGSIYLIPVRLDDCQVPDLQIHDLGQSLRNIQWVDFFQESDFARLRDAIVQALGNGKPRLARGMGQSTGTPPAPLTDDFISITDAVEHIGVQSKWGKGKELENLSFEAAAELDQAAYDGRIEIRGMQEERAPLGMPRLLRRKHPA